VGVSPSRRAGARIVVTGVGESSATARSFLRAELTGVRLAETQRTGGGAFDETLHDADMLLFVADAGEQSDAERAGLLAEAARERGMLVAAVVVNRERLPGRSPLLAALREAADMVVVVRDPSDVHAVVAALR
jgi:hypothetical protein